MTTMPLIFNLNSWEVLVVVFLILLLFGGKKIPELARGLGKGIREFNNARSSIETEIKERYARSRKKTGRRKEGADIKELLI